MQNTPEKNTMQNVTDKSMRRAALTLIITSLTYNMLIAAAAMTLATSSTREPVLAVVLLLLIAVNPSVTGDVSRGLDLYNKHK